MHKLATIFQQGADKLLESKLTLSANTPLSPRVNQDDNVVHDNSKKLSISSRAIESKSLPKLSPSASSTQKELQLNQERHYIDTLLILKIH